MIVLFSDFGLTGPYIGQVKAVLARRAPDVPVIDLFADAPAFDIEACATLLAAYAADFNAGDVFWCVVDPGVGTERLPLIVDADGRWFVGPDNGLFAGAAARASTLRCWEITWRPERLSASFHGRDLFAPVAAMLACGEPPPGTLADPGRPHHTDWSPVLARIVYIDHFGNLMTGLWAEALDRDARVAAAGQTLSWARTFAEVPAGTMFWYENANGLVEIAVNRGSAAATLGLEIGDPVVVVR